MRKSTKAVSALQRTRVLLAPIFDMKILVAKIPISPPLKKELPIIPALNSAIEKHSMSDGKVLPGNIIASPATNMDRYNIKNPFFISYFGKTFFEKNFGNG